MLGLSTPHVNRMIRCAREEGLAIIDGPHVNIHNLGALASLAGFDVRYYTPRRTSGIPPEVDRCPILISINAAVHSPVPPPRLPLVQFSAEMGRGSVRGRAGAWSQGPVSDDLVANVTFSRGESLHRVQNASRFRTVGALREITPGRRRAPIGGLHQEPHKLHAATPGVFRDALGHRDGGVDRAEETLETSGTGSRGGRGESSLAETSLIGM